MSDHPRGLKRIVDRVRRKVHERAAVPGVEPVDISGLITPLRYDVAVRAQFFDFLGEHADLTGPSLVEAASHTPYAAWFEHVECARYFPALMHDEQSRHERFAARVAGAVRLLRSFEQDGFDPAHPVTLIAAPAGAVSDSGAPAMGNLHIGDGCHRLSLLLRQGAQLEPSMYRVRPLLSPLVDNTAVLLANEAITESAYIGYLAARFPVGQAETVRAAAEHVESVDPSLSEVLTALLAAQWEPIRRNARGSDRKL